MTHKQLAYMMLVQAPAAASDGTVRGGVEWLFASADKQMSAVMSSIHDDPAHRWTLQEVVERASLFPSVQNLVVRPFCSNPLPRLGTLHGIPARIAPTMRASVDCGE